MSFIKKKTWPKYFEAVKSGKKKFDLRINEFAIKEGDTLVLEEWDPEKKAYTGRTLEKKVTYVAKFKIDQLFWSEKEVKDKGLVVVSLE